jgi:uncharacterized protein YneF (UPF0154 family)
MVLRMQSHGIFTLLLVGISVIVGIVIGTWYHTAVYQAASLKDAPRTESEQQEQVFLFIAIGSSPENVERRIAIRATWAKWLSADRRTTKAIYRFFMERTNSTEKEALEMGDMVFTNTRTGRRDYFHRAMQQMEYAIQKWKFDYYLKMDDDTFLCVREILAELENRPRMRFFWGKFRQNGERTSADENFMLFSSDVIQWFVSSSFMLQRDPKTTFAMNFGFWQYFLNLTIFDDRRLDAQQQYRTRYMHRPINQTDVSKRELSTFCERYLYAHRADISAIYAVFQAAPETYSSHAIPALQSPGDICAYPKCAFRSNELNLLTECECGFIANSLRVPG